MRMFFLLIPVLLIHERACAQEDSLISPWIVGARGHYGFVWAHSRDVRNVDDAYPYGLELDLSRHFTGADLWTYCYCYLRTGFSMLYFNYDNPGLLGKGYTLGSYFEPFINAEDRLSLSFRIMFGLNYSDRPYDKESNPDNMSYSTHFNVYAQAGLSLYYRIDERWLIHMTAAYNHISNGGVSVPNKGINYPTLSLGMDYMLQTARFPDRMKDNYTMEEKAKRRYDVGMLATGRNVSPGRRARYLATGLEVKASWQVGRISAITVGGELIRDYAIKKKASLEGNNTDYHWAGLLAGHEFLLGRLLFSQELGLHVYNPYYQDKKDLLYQRYGLKMRVWQGLHLGFSVMTHRHVAHQLDFRLSWALVQ